MVRVTGFEPAAFVFVGHCSSIELHDDTILENIPTAVKDWTSVRTGKYTSNPIMVHYWIHGDFESKNLLNIFKPDVNYNIHYNMYIFFKILYPNIEKIDNLS